MTAADVFKFNNDSIRNLHLRGLPFLYLSLLVST